MTIDGAAKASSSPLVGEIYERNGIVPKTNAANSEVPLAEARTIADDAAPRWHGSFEPSVVVEGTSAQPRTHTQYYISKDQTGRQLISRRTRPNDPFCITANEPVELPSRCQIRREVNQTTIELPWLTSFAYFLLFITIAWDAAVIANANQCGIFLLILFSWIAIGLAYMVACLFVNSTRIIITNDCVQIDQHPLKVSWCYSGPTIVVTFAKTGYEEVRVKRTVIPATRSKPPTIKWEVVIVDLESGTSTDVPMLYYCSKEEALFVAQEVRKYLTPWRTEASAPTEMGDV